MEQQNPMIVDTDAGFDDFIAMSSIQNFTTSAAGDIQFVSTVAGIQNQPSRSIKFIQKHFPQAIVTTGADGPSTTSAVEEWLIEYRKNLNSFINKESEPSSSTAQKENQDTKSGDDDNNPETVLNDFLKKQKDNNVDILCIGPLTNIAQWVSSPITGPLLQQKVKSVWIMGGNMPTASTENPSSKELNISKETEVEAEFNFAQDPMAANTVLSSPIIAEKMYVLPAETCIDVSPTNETWTKILELAKSRTGLISKILNVDADYGHFKYDPLCAFSYVRNESFRSEKMAVEVNASTGLVSIAKEIDGKQQQPIKFITHVEHDGENGFLSWMRKLVEKEPRSGLTWWKWIAHRYFS